MKYARTIREQRGETLFDVARATGIQSQVIAKFETDDTRTLRWPGLTKLAAHYGVPEADLMRVAPAPKVTA